MTEPWSNDILDKAVAAGDALMQHPTIKGLFNAHEEMIVKPLRDENARLRLALDGIASDVRVRGCEACAEKESMARIALGGAA